MDDYNIDNEKEKIDVLFVSSECTPFCARGGLADFSNAIPKYLDKSKSVNISVVLPYYSTIKKEYSENFELVGERTVELKWRKEYCGIYKYEFNNITYYFIDNKHYFGREKLYGYADDIERFSFFSKAVLEMLPIINFFPDIIHANDWQTGLVNVFLKVLAWQNPKYEHIKSVLTIHNISFQGKCDFSMVRDLFDIEDKFAYLFDFFGSANILKASILCADQIVTVSNTYKEEILTDEKGCGLNNVLASVDYKFSAIAGGVDYKVFNPRTDEHIYVNYSKNSIAKKVENKLELQKELGLAVNENFPMFAFVGFMDHGKGIDLISASIKPFLESGAQLVVVGLGNPEFEDYFKRLALSYPEKVCVKTAYDAILPHKLYAGCDFLLSLATSEPCGQTPLIANKYGCLPIVYLTGGIKDNFTDFRFEGGNGYILKDYNATALSDLLSRAVRHFYNKEKFEEYIKSAMEQDFDIEDTAEAYLELYEDMS